MRPASTRFGRRSFLHAMGWGVGAATALAATGCSDDGGGEGGFTGEAAVAHAEAMTNAAPWLIARELGYFRQNGLELEIVSFPGGTATIRGMTSGMPIGMPATVAGLIAFQKGQRELRLVSGAVNDALVNFVVPAASPIQSLADLRGKKIAVSRPGSITTYFATRIVREQGLVPGQDVQILHLGGPPDAWTAAEQGIADVTYSLLPLSQRLISEGQARLLVEARQLVPDWADNTYWTTQDFIDESPEAVSAWLRAMQQAITTIQNDLDKAAQAYATGAKLNPALARAALEQARSAFSLQIDRKGIDENVKAGAELGQLDPQRLNVDELIVTDFVDNVLRGQ